MAEDVSQKPLFEEEYIGDAVYVKFDGYQFWLRTGDSGEQRIALEPGVFLSLLKYVARAWGRDSLIAFLNRYI